jgi:hypothetical protein
MFDFALTAERRREICIHEAAHAVIHALGGISVYSIEVAPVGVTEWTTIGTYGNEINDSWGICMPDFNPAFSHLSCNEEDDCLEANLDSLKRHVQMLIDEPNGRKLVENYRRKIRAHVCATLAGPIADEIVKGVIEGEIWLVSYAINDDVASAEVTCRLLPFCREFQYHAIETELLLRTPEVWDRVIKLADALEQAGRIDYDDMSLYLPKTIKDWPKSARCKDSFISNFYGH